MQIEMDDASCFAIIVISFCIMITLCTVAVQSRYKNNQTKPPQDAIADRIQLVNESYLKSDDRDALIRLIIVTGSTNAAITAEAP